MRLQLIICKVLQKEAYYCAARSPNTVDIRLMPQGLHNEPDKLRAEVQAALDVTTDIRGCPYDASLLGYGLCSNGIVGLSAKIPIVASRAHDCITLLLGSKEKYQSYFDAHPGTYWFSTGWIETDTQPGKDRYEKTLKEYIQKFGHDNAKFLMQTEQSWLSKYKYATYIDWNLPNAEKEKQFTKQAAQFLDWNYDEVKGDPSLLQRLLDGQWSNNDFLIVKPGQKIAENLTTDQIIKAE